MVPYEVSEFLSAIVAAAIGAISALAVSYFSRKSDAKLYVDETRRAKAEELALSILDLKAAASAAGRSETHVEAREALVDTQAIEKIDVLARFYFSRLDLTQFYQASEEYFQVSKELVAIPLGEVVPTEWWPRYTSAAARLETVTNDLLEELKLEIANDLR